MKLVMVASMLMSMTFMKSSHPVMLMFIILAQTMILCTLIWVVTGMNWFSYILFLIFLGGLMVLFVYISSLASNEMFNLNVSGALNSVVALGVLAALTTMLINNQTTTQVKASLTSSFNSVYSNSMVAPSMTTMLYLLLTLIAVVKMTSKYEGPLRNMIFSS